MLQGKKIVLGICGSIAAYKTTFLVRLLIKEGAEVQVIQTNASKDFVTPISLATLSKKPVYSDFTKNEMGEWVNHVDLGIWADLILIAPASANTIAKMAHGICDNLLTAVYLSAKCQTVVAPAMDLDMYVHPTTKENLAKLANHKVSIIEAEDGELASGLVGVGRMAEPEHIISFLKSHFKSPAKLLSGKKVLITSGPTFEAIDPVRFIGNHSSGKMGLALAEEALKMGAEVEVISGPTSHVQYSRDIKITKVISADEMLQATRHKFSSADIAIFAAAVADYRPMEAAPQKIKKSEETLTINLVKNKDIALEMSALKKPTQITVGFALETENEEQNAKDKLNKKKFDILVLNSLNHEGAGFAGNTNKVTIFTNDNKRQEFELKSKQEVAADIFAAIVSKLKQP
jgi:phosphopantothenoylcysteine decarboxylase/phosphopantothenate--cysteine ligase